LSLLGSSTYTGSTEVESGTLQLSGTLTSAINVSGGATLSGNGSTTAGVQIASKGVVAPGSLNTLHIGGNLSLAPGAILSANVTPQGGSSRIAVSGSPTLSGAALAVSASGSASSYLPSTVYTLLTASQGVNGTFQQTTSSLALLAPKVTYLPDAVDLSLVQLQAPNTGAGQGINPQLPSGSTGSGGNGSNTSSGSLITNLDTLTSGQLANALGSLGASTYASLRRLNLNESGQFAREVAAHNFSVDSGYGASDTTAWLSLLTRRTSADALFGSLTDRDEGLIGGSDLYTDGTTRVAVAAQVLHSSIDLGGGNSGSSDRYDIGLIGTARNGPWLFTGLLSAGHHSDDVNRFIEFGDYVAGPSSHPSGYNMELYGETGAEIDEGVRTWMPYAALDVAMASDDSFEEGGGGAADLFGRARRANLLTSTLGVRLVQPISFTAGADNQNWLIASAAWLHDSACTDGRVDASFLSDASNTVFSSTAPNFARDRLLMSAELHAQWQQHWQAQFRLVGEAGAGTRSIEGYSGISYIW
jgi:fibronectin-binding autotransporter adhesin